MAPVATMRQLLESGVHFGHETRRWNPKMKRCILAERILAEGNGIYIIDLQQSLDFIDRACEFIRETMAHGGISFTAISGNAIPRTPSRST